MSAAVDVGRMPIEVTDRGRAAPKCGVACALLQWRASMVGKPSNVEIGTLH